LELINQWSLRFANTGIVHGVIMANDPRRNPNAPVQIASIQTLVRREFPPADLVIIDEAHHAKAATYERVVEHYPNTFLLGLTATPRRLDQLGLGDIFSALVCGPSIAWLVENGYLAKPRVFAGPEPDLRGIRIIAGDFDRHALAERCDKKQLVGDLVANYTRLSSGRQAIAYAVNIAHALAIAARFNEAGIPAVELDGTTPAFQRADLLARFRDKEIRVLSNCGLFTEGLDVPSVQAILIARPTQSETLHLQMLGRGLRRDLGKLDCHILDHAGNARRLGLPEEEWNWSLETTKKEHPSADHDDYQKCPLCGWLAPPDYCGPCEGLADSFEGAEPEPCPYVFKPKKARVPVLEVIPADLEEVQLPPRPPLAAADPQWIAYQRAALLHVPAELKNDAAIARHIQDAYQRKHKPGSLYYVSRELTAARTRYREQFGHPPPAKWLAWGIQHALEASW
jgi:superfamily II DNA or RNA helicase